MIVRYTKDALKFLKKLDKKSADRIIEGINGLLQTPPKGDIKQMKGFTDMRMRLRIGGWRVIYRYDAEGVAEILIVLDIGNRGDIYK